MRRRVLSIVVLSALVLVTGLYLSAAEKTVVCHVEDKDSRTGHYINVASSSVDAHLSHGDCVETGPVGDPCSCLD